jgi:alkanesulfonate monooxygenase SsuD/methylene tetrahydromethanopterin reductase-like flavin-dependent oxidoreductase (luciferase family)
MPYPSPEDAAAHVWTDEDKAMVADRVDTQFVGAPASVAKSLVVLQDATAADELMIVTNTHAHPDRIRSYELLAREWGTCGSQPS